MGSSARGALSKMRKFLKKVKNIWGKKKDSTTNLTNHSNERRRKKIHTYPQIEDLKEFAEEMYKS